MNMIQKEGIDCEKDKRSIEEEDTKNKKADDVNEKEISSSSDGDEGSDDDDVDVDDDDDIDDEEALSLYRRFEEEKSSVVGSLELAYARNIRGKNGGTGHEKIRHDESISKFVETLTHIMLDRERIEYLNERLATTLMTGQCTHLHLQHNRLTDISFSIKIKPGLCNLKYLHLGHNRLTSLEGLNACDQLVYVDVSHNKLNDIPPEELPRLLKYFNIVGNPCAEDKGTLS